MQCLPCSLCRLPCVVVELSGGGTDRRRLHCTQRALNGSKTHLSVYMEVQDAMWKPRSECKITVVNQADASKSCAYGQF
jgi:hypothetical protein